MRYLLDTHVIIWLAKDSPELPIGIINIVKQLENDMYISSVSLWEITIKMSLGKLGLKLPLDKLLNDLKTSGFNILQIEDEYLKKLSALPFIHKDPFDRIIISTALAENLTIITIDENIQRYDVSWIW